VPGFGFWVLTRPLFTLAVNARVTFPTEQCARLIAFLAAARLLPFTLGTMQSALKVAVTEWLALILSVQVPVPEQAPAQPGNEDLDAAEAVGVTEAPCA